MTQKYIKVYPTTEDIGKTAVIVADETAPNGVSIDFIDSINADDYSEGDFIYRNADGFVSKSISEIKSLLGMSKETILLNPTLLNLGSSTLELKNIVFNPQNTTITIVKGANGLYTFEFNSSWLFGAGYSRIDIKSFYGGVMDGMPSNYTMSLSFSANNFLIQFKNSGVNADLPIGQSMDLRIKVERYS